MHEIHEVAALGAERPSTPRGGRRCLAKQVLSAAQQIGADLGGHDTEVLDKEEALDWALDHRPEVLVDLDAPPGAMDDDFRTLLQERDLYM